MAAETTVVHWDNRPLRGEYAYIGRPTQFGNPYPIKEFGRREAIERYRTYFELRIMRSPFRKLVEGLRGKVLVCHCKPMACHGDVIVEWLESH